ncbi:hypothetical protein CW751_01370 [Brumimicrobium salinarum]|uniref:Uncharacterized protein n=1 Tax=Brumimicrobium salinarum TaxID=2058658 RepID=A0A2I0R625_9FLAO|nr:hypothetical protein [Brumimicrobium salinarum]PKR82015.1 hypothetical protein CW751_01370 [Brumimicrobium salinarum]
MKIFLFGVSLCLLCFISCKKINSIKKLEDDIVFKMFNPYLSLTPTDSVIEITSSDCFIPYHKDTSARIFLDFDHDGTDDYEMIYSIHYDSISEDSCMNYHSKITFKSAVFGHTVFVTDKNTNKVMFYDDKQPIVNTSVTSANQAIIYDNSPNNSFTDADKENNIIGFQLLNGKVGWLKFFLLKDQFQLKMIEYAYNDQVQLKIKAGQKE